MIDILNIIIQTKVLSYEYFYIIYEYVARCEEAKSSCTEKFLQRVLVRHYCVPIYDLEANCVEKLKEDLHHSKLARRSNSMIASYLARSDQVETKVIARPRLSCARGRPKCQHAKPDLIHATFTISSKTCGSGKARKGMLATQLLILSSYLLLH